MNMRDLRHACDTHMKGGCILIFFFFFFWGGGGGGSSEYDLTCEDPITLHNNNNF